MSLKDLAKLAESEQAKKFTAVVSNPPYQQDNGDSANSPSVYHHFMEVAKLFSEKLSFIYPSKWGQGGAGEGLNEFRERELASKYYLRYFDYSDATSLFSGIQLGGGVNYFLWSSEEHNGPIDRYYNGVPFPDSFTLGNGLSTMVRGPSAFKVIEKINTCEGLGSSMGYMSYLKPGIKTASDLEKWISDSNEDSSRVKVWYVSKDQGFISKPLSTRYLQKNDTGYKVGVSAPAHSTKGKAIPRADRIFKMGPDEVSATGLLVGSFETEAEATNAIRYLKTDFCNFLMGIITPTQNTTWRNYILIPRINFSTGEILDRPGSLLDFSQPDTLDDQLAKIYELTEEEQELMRKDLKPWKDKVDVEADR